MSTTSLTDIDAIQSDITQKPFEWGEDAQQQQDDEIPEDMFRPEPWCPSPEPESGPIPSDAQIEEEYMDRYRTRKMQLKSDIIHATDELCMMLNPPTSSRDHMYYDAFPPHVQAEIARATTQFMSELDSQLRRGWEEAALLCTPPHMGRVADSTSPVCPPAPKKKRTDRVD